MSQKLQKSKLEFWASLISGILYPVLVGSFLFPGLFENFWGLK